MKAEDTPVDIIKKDIYGDYRESVKRKDKIHEKAIHKALDLAEDPMGVNVNNTTTGIGTKGAIGIATAAAGIPALAMLAMSLLNKPEPVVIQQQPSQPIISQQPVQQPTVVQPQGDEEREFIIRFYDDAGNLIEIPHISKRPQ